jgi:aspartyl protease family protein
MKRRLVLAAAAVWAGSAARAQSGPSVSLAGRMGDRALLVVDGTPYTVAVGARAGGVQLVQWAGDEALVDVAGTRVRLRLGGTPALLGGTRAAAPSVREIVLTASSGGHFTPVGSINGQTVRFVVDTGATLVAMGRDEALRLKVDLSQARSGVSQTANGPVPVQIVVLDRVRVGEVEIVNVGAVVMPQPMPYVLLGNSFLSRFQMQRENDVMRLQLR